MNIGLTTEAQLTRLYGGRWIVKAFKDVLAGVTAGYHVEHSVDDAHTDIHALTLALSLQPRARVYASAAQAIATATRTVLAFDTEVYNVGAVHTVSVALNARMTVPVGQDGFWRFTAIVPFAANATGNTRQVTIRQNGTDLRPFFLQPPLAATDLLTLTAVQEVSAVGGDYFEVTAYQDSGGNLDIGNGTSSRVEFMAERLW